MSGQRVEDLKAKSLLEKKQIVVFVRSGQKLDSRYRSVINPSTLIIKQLQSPAPITTPPVAPNR